MARGSNKLTAMLVQKIKEPGRYGDGGGLYLQVGKFGGKSWLFRYTRLGKAREMGLGALSTISLAEARERAGDVRKILASGQDPLKLREAEVAKTQAEEAKSKTFSECATAYIEAHESTWRNPKHRQQWRNTIATYVTPVFGALPVQEIDLPLVMKVIEPIWKVKPETAGRVRGRIEAVLDWASVRGFRKGENPARWKGHLDHLLPAKSKVRKVEHHAALSYEDVGNFIKALRDVEGTSSKGLEFQILTATRTGEVIGAKWGEIDLAKKVWTIPGERMKAGREHRVPLSNAAMAVLKAVEPLRNEADFVFPGGKAGKGLSSMAFLMTLRRMKRGDLTAHGFRSTFRDWCAECTAYPRDVAEMALAHAIGDRVEAAYRRGDLFEKRRHLMETWANYCGQPIKKGKVGKVVSLKSAM